METIKVGTLIIGSGGTGLRCAIEMSRAGISDLLVVGSRRINDAHTVVAAGGINAALGTMDPDDSWLVHAVDTYREAQHLSDPRLVEILTKDAPSAIEDLLEMGAQFHQGEDGSLTQRFFGAHTYRRTVFSGDQTGREIIRALHGECEKLEVGFIEKFFVDQLIVIDGKAVGVEGLSYDGERVRILSGNTVIASGGYSKIYKRSSSRPGENYGTMIGAAIEVGVTVGDMELVQFHPTGLIKPDSLMGTLVTESVRGEGGILRNRDGDRFMKKYDPDKLELSTRDIVARANYQEIVSGRGTQSGGVLLDISHQPLDYIKSRLPHMYELLRYANGIDISKESMEVAPTAHYTMGGIKVDENSMTNIENLYAVGECTMGVHGANRLGGNSLAEILVFGKRLGIYLANNKNVAPTAYSEPKKELLNTRGYMSYQYVVDKVPEIMWSYAGIVRDGGSLRKADSILSEMLEMFDHTFSAELGSIVEFSKARAALYNGLLTVRGALKRAESRGAHYRTDFPETDTAFRKNFLFTRTGGDFNEDEVRVATPSEKLSDGLKSIEHTKNYEHLE